MREDQRIRLQELAERLADSFLIEADPREWSGGGGSPADLTKEQRGDAYWCKKNAMATGGVLRYTLDLMDKHGGVSKDEPQKDSDLDRQIRDAENRATAAVNRALDKAKKTEFDKRLHGG